MERPLLKRPGPEVQGVVYVITNLVNNMKYVGQTTSKNIPDYWNGHLSFAQHPSTRPIHVAIREYGAENFKFEVVFTVFDRTELDVAEDCFITALNTLAPNGYNMQSGGRSGYTPSDELRRKMSKAQIEVLARPGVRERIQASVTAYNSDLEYRDRQRQKTLELYADPNYRARHKAAHNTPQFRAKIAEQLERTNAQRSVLMSSKRWITDGTQNQRISEGDLPEGWWHGRAKTPALLASAVNARLSPSFRNRGQIWINNGSTNRMIPASDSLPDGWVSGMLR